MVNAGGVENILVGGRSDHTTINAGGVENVQAGVSDKLASATTINAGGVLNILKGGAAELTNINGGKQLVESGGKSFDVKINSDGVETVEKGALSDRGTINAGGVQNVFGTSNATINAGGVENVQKGGLSDRATINDGGVENLLGTGLQHGEFTGGKAIETTINNGTLNVQAGALARGIVFAGSHSTLDLADPQSLAGTIHNWHVGDAVDFLNTSVTSVQQTGNMLKVVYSGGTDSYKLSNVAPQAEFKLESDGHGGTNLILAPILTYTAPPNQTDLVLNSGYVLNVNSGGLATRTTINNGGIENVSGGTAANSTINTGGLENVGSGGASTGTTINGGGVEVILSGGKASDTNINAGGTEKVLSGAASTGATVNAGGVQEIQIGGDAVHTTVHSGAVQNVYGGGTATNTVIDGGLESILDAGQASNVEFAGSGGTLRVPTPSQFTGTISNWRVGDVVDFVNTTVTDVSGTNGVLTVSYGGQKASYQLAGQQPNTEFTLQSDGNGGTDILLAHTAPPNQTGLVLNTGDILNIHAGGTATNTTVNNGGVENVLNGGLSELSTIHGGGGENVQSGGRAIGANLEGGVENVQGGGLADNVRFGDAGNSILNLASPLGLKGAISNWRVGDVIDFLNTSVTGAQKTGDVLTVTYGSDKASYQLAGQQANTAFNLQSDGHGGTDLILTPLVGVQQHHEVGHLMALK